MNISDPRIAYFDNLSVTWDSEEPSGETMTRRLRQQKDLLALSPGVSLLEVGCGTGKTTGWLAEQVAPGRVMGIDFAPGMIDRAQGKGIDADFACKDVCRDDLGTGVYDVILCFHSFPHFRDQSAALGNLARALTPTGRLIVMHLAGSEQINRFHAALTDPVNVDLLPGEGQWPGLLSQAGLEQKALHDREDLFFLEATRT